VCGVGRVHPQRAKWPLKMVFDRQIKRMTRRNLYVPCQIRSRLLHEFSNEAQKTVVRCDRFLAGAYLRGEESWPVFNLFDLVESNVFLQASAE
jgi:hypothetical protein